MSEETVAATVEEAVEEAQNEPKVKELLLAFPDAPTNEDIEAFKDKFGEVLCSGFSASEIFIFRPLTRLEFVQMQQTLSQAQTINDQLEVEESVVRNCILWGSAPGMKSLQTKGGSLSTLNEQIMQNSNFVNPAMAASLVVKL